MLAAEKPLALFSVFVEEMQILPDGEFAPHVRGGRPLKRDWEVSLPHMEEGMPQSITCFWRSRMKRGGWTTRMKS